MLYEVITNVVRVVSGLDVAGLSSGRTHAINLGRPLCENMHSDYDQTIWENYTMHGYPEKTYSRGRLVFDNGEFVGESGWGKFLKRKLT